MCLGRIGKVDFTSGAFAGVKGAGVGQVDFVKQAVHILQIHVPDLKSSLVIY
jgi:hypothetical protein